MIKISSLDYFKGNKAIKTIRSRVGCGISSTIRPRLEPKKIKLLVHLLSQDQYDKHEVAKKVGCIVATVERYERWIKRGGIK